MTSIDELFKRPSSLTSTKRKLDSFQDAAQVYKSAKVSANGDAKGKAHATVDDVEDEDLEAGPQLPPDDESDDYGPEDDEEGRFFGGGVDQNTRQALDYLESRDAEEEYLPEKFDNAWVRKLITNFEKKINKNAELRAKYADDPAKFMSSEADLDSEIRSLSNLSEHPELYEEFVKAEGVQLIVAQLAHENTDIALHAIEIISELTDEDVEADQAQWDALVNAMLEADLLSLLMDNLGRFNEADETDRGGIYHSLSVIENLASQSDLSSRVGRDTTILKWLLERIKEKENPITQNKQYATEVLAILLQSSAGNVKKLVADVDGVDNLLMLIAPYRKRDPPKDSPEEEEYFENLFNALICAVESEVGKVEFVEREGVELCLIMLREGKMSKLEALRLLDHAAGGQHGAEVCKKIVEATGLKTLFGMFMKKQDASTTEHLLGILASMLRSLPGESAERIRTLAKFVEKDYQKITRVIKLRRDYAAKVSAVDQQIKQERRALSKEDHEDMEDEWLSRRLDAGLYCLQTCDVILAWCVAEDDGAKTKIVELLGETDENLAGVRKTLDEQLDDLEGEELRGEQRVMKDMLGTLVTFLR